MERHEWTTIFPLLLIRLRLWPRTQIRSLQEPLALLKGFGRSSSEEESEMIMTLRNALRNALRGALCNYILGYLKVSKGIQIATFALFAKLLLEIALVSIGIATGLVCLVIYGLERLGILTVQVNYGQVVVVTQAAGNWVIAEIYVIAPLVMNALTQFTAPTGGFGLGFWAGLKKG